MKLTETERALGLNPIPTWRDAFSRAAQAVAVCAIAGFSAGCGFCAAVWLYLWQTGVAK